MAESWAELARRIEAKPWNRPGTDKTWVLNALSQHRLFAKEVKNARSNERSGRPKDVEFLRVFAARASDERED